MGIFVWTSNMNPKPVKFCGAQKNTRKRNPVHWRPSSEICWAFAVPLSMRVRISETEAELPPSLVFCSGLFFILVIRTFWSLWECIIESMLAEYLWWTCILASFLDSFFISHTRKRFNTTIYSHCTVPLFSCIFWFLWRPEINIHSV